MPTLTLDRLWINNFATGAGIGAYSAARSYTHTNLGEVKHLAGGRQRAVRTVGEQTSFSFTLLDVSRADRDMLRTLKGETLQFRNDRGDLIIGAFFTVGSTETRDKKGFFEVSLSVRGVTAEEGV